MRASDTFSLADLGKSDEKVEHRNRARRSIAIARDQYAAQNTYAGYKAAIAALFVAQGDAEAAKGKGVAELAQIKELIVKYQNEMLRFPEAKAENDATYCKYCFPQIPDACDRMKKMPAIFKSPPAAEPHELKIPEGMPETMPDEALPLTPSTPTSTTTSSGEQVVAQIMESKGDILKRAGIKGLAALFQRPKLEPLVYELGRAPQRLYPLSGLGEETPVVTEAQKEDILKSWEEESKEEDFAITEGGVLSVAIWKCLHYGEDMLPYETEAIAKWAQIMIDTGQFEETWQIVEEKLRPIAGTRSAFFGIALWKSAAGLQWSALEAGEYKHWKDKKESRAKKARWTKIGIIVAAAVAAVLTAGLLIPGLLPAIGSVLSGAAGLVWSGIAAVGKGIAWAATGFWKILAFGAKQLAKGVSAVAGQVEKLLTSDAATKTAQKSVVNAVTNFVEKQKEEVPTAVTARPPDPTWNQAPPSSGYMAIPGVGTVPWYVLAGGAGFLLLGLFVLSQK